MATSKRMSAVIFEQRAGTSQNLKHLLNEFGDINLIGITHHLNSGLEMVQKYKPDIFFLDEQILNESAKFSLLDLSKQNPKTYFILTCQSEDKSSLLSNNGIPDCIARPFDRDKLYGIIERKQADNQIKAIQDQLAALSRDKHTERVMLTTKTGYLFLNPKKIVFCKADSNYTKVALLDEKSIIVTKSLCHFYEETLCFPQFIRINRSTVINKQYLSEIIKAERKCILEVKKQTYSFTLSPEYYKLLKNNDFSRCASINGNMPSHTKMPSLINMNN